MTDFPITGGAVAVALLGGDFPYRGALAVPVVGGSLVYDAGVIAGLSSPAVPGGSVLLSLSLTGGVVSPAVLGGVIYVGITPAIVSPAVLGGDISANFSIAAALESAAELGGDLVAFTSIVGGVDSPAFLGGEILAGEIFYGGVESEAVLGGQQPFPGDEFIRVTIAFITVQGIVSRASVGGTIIATKAQQFDPDAEYNRLGYRRGTPVVVYAINVFDPSGVADVPFGKPFLMSGAYSGAPGSVFYESGAGANFVGYKLGSVGKVSYAFRPPVPALVLWNILDNCLYRYEVSRKDQRAKWSKYRTMPQRFLDGSYAFNAFDPDKIYDYYASVAGGVQSQMQSDNAVIRVMRDYDKIPDYLLSVAADTYDVDIEPDDSEARLRTRLAMAPAISRERGLSAAINLRLMSMGYRGGCTEIWKRITWAACALTTWTDATTSDSNIMAVTSPAGGGFVVYFYQNLTTLSGDVTLDDGTVIPGTRTLGFDLLLTWTSGNVSKFHIGGPKAGFITVNYVVDVDDNILPQQTMANLVNAINAVHAMTADQVDSSWPATQDYPHGYLITEPGVYWSSNRINVHVNNFDGTPLDITAEMKATFTRALQLDTIPMYVQIGGYATDVSLGDEGVSVTDALSITLVP